MEGQLEEREPESSPEPRPPPEEPPDLLHKRKTVSMLDNSPPEVEIRITEAPPGASQEQLVPPSALVPTSPLVPPSPLVPLGATLSPPTPTPPNPPTPQTPYRRDHTGRTPLHQQSTRSSIGSPLATPHVLNPRYAIPEDGSSTTVGDVLTKYPILMWFLCCLTPLAYLLLVFGAIPIGERKDDDHDPGKVAEQERFHRYWVFTCVVNPLNMMVIAFLNCGIFLSCMGVERPFRVHWSILLSVYVVTGGVFTAIVPFTGTFDFLGVASLFLCYTVTFVAIYRYETWKLQRTFKEVPDELMQELIILHKNFWQFVKVAVAFLIFFLVLLLYMWAYEHVGSGLGQKMLPFCMTIGVFIVRKCMLALTDHFPLNTAMLISGFWVENIYDMFQVCTYRNVKLPVNYVSVWFTNALSLLANLVFLTDTWFMFRIWIKAYLPRMFTGKCCPYKLGIQPDYTEIEDERGHSNNKIGYHRRQARFFMYKVFSKCIAACFYFLISTVLRYGLNNQLFPYAPISLPYAEYQHSLIFCLCNFIFLLCAGFSAALYVRTRHRSLFDHFVRARSTLKSRYMLGAVVALLINNGIVAISMIMYFNQIYYVVQKE